MSPTALNVVFEFAATDRARLVEDQSPLATLMAYEGRVALMPGCGAVPGDAGPVPIFGTVVEGVATPFAMAQLRDPLDLSIHWPADGRALRLRVTPDRVVPVR